MENAKTFGACFRSPVGVEVIVGVVDPGTRGLGHRLRVRGERQFRRLVGVVIAQARFRVVVEQSKDVGDHLINY